ncbi:MAG: hypothetical protein PHP10_03685 [Candidatus Omnitrophica bacterium]|nr:hypothetical protein [Candidatus Omnitrophota bacterium]
MAKDKFKPGFDPIWSSEFLDLKLKKMSRTTFILRQMYRSYRDPKTNLCTLSDWQIYYITGWHRRAIRKAREHLIKLGEIIPTGYHSFAVKTFHQFNETGALKALPDNSDQSPKGSTSSALKAPDQSPKGSTSSALKALPLYTDNTDTDIQIKDFVCKDCQNYEPEHLDSKGVKAGYCPILLVALPPYSNAVGCKHKKPIPAESEAKT